MRKADRFATATPMLARSPMEIAMLMHSVTETEQEQ